MNVTISRQDGGPIDELVLSTFVTSDKGEETSLNLNEAGQLKKAEKEFLKQWSDDDWRIRCCPGKEVLKRLRKWLQDTFSLTLSIKLMFECYKPSEAMQSLMDALEKHIV